VVYRSLPSHHQLPELEREVLRFWEENRIFQKSIESRDPNRAFVFYEGPPTANGRPGIHHVISRTIKDFVCRLRTMQGYYVERKAGWDTHGLPVEIEVEKELGIEGKEQILKYGVDKFNQRCKENVFRYKKDWDELTRRIAFWVDLENPYITYTNEYIESVWWILKEFWKKGLLYQGAKIIAYCPRCETALSSHEVSLGYKEVPDPSIYVKMKVKGEENTYFLVWTTTPWTLISNVALAVHPDVTYVKIRRGSEYWILAEARLLVVDGEFERVAEFKGKDLLDKEYEPLFRYLEPEPGKRAWYVIPGDFVTTEDGTGIVHIAPAFGEDDFKVGRQFDLPVFQPVDKSGRFTDEITDFKGLFVKKADPKIIEKLKAEGALYLADTVVHSYPHCWRCESPLLYYAKKSWYIRTTAKKDRLIANNRKIQWIPREVGEGRFGEWLENNVDWALSRDRFWGTPLNIWQCPDCGHQDMVGGRQELLERAGIEDIPDLHKPYIDEVRIPCEKCGGKMQRVPEVIDVWFDSGAMPYAQWHYPFENQEKFKRNFPADFIAEGIDQTRGWFYSLLAISTLLFDQPAYKTCLSIELILDKEGQKMSKSRGNTVDPFEIIDRYGADALRWYLLVVSPPWVPTRFDPDGVLEVQKKFFGTLLNTYAFFAMYANIDDFRYAEEPIPVEQRPEIDRWILSARNRLVARVNDYLLRYDLTKAARAIADFTIEDLSNWYVRRSRRRFWKSEMGQEKLSAYQTLYDVLFTLTKLIAPYAPFTADALYRSLNAIGKEPYESVHLAFYPDSSQEEYRFLDEELLDRMEIARYVVSVARALRSEAGVKVRQPLKRMVVATPSERRRRAIREMEALIREEINIKNIELLDNPDHLFVLRARPNYKSLGPKFGKDVKKIVEIVDNMKPVDVARLQKEGQLELTFEGREIHLTTDDILIQTENPPNMVVHNEDGLAIGLDLTITDDLKREGLAREFVNRVQNMRKEAGYEITDRIRICFEGPSELARAVEEMRDYIQTETLAESVNGEFQDLDYTKEWKINEYRAKISIERIKSE